MAGKDLLGGGTSSGGKNLLDDTPAPKVEADKPKKTIGERATQFGESVLGGGIVGAASPELTMGAGKAISMIPNPYAKATGYGMEAAGRLMRGERGISAGMGALGGATGDIAGQTVEVKGGTAPAVFFG